MGLNYAVIRILNLWKLILKILDTEELTFILFYVIQ